MCHFQREKHGWNLHKQEMSWMAQRPSHHNAIPCGTARALIEALLDPLVLSASATITGDEITVRICDHVNQLDWNNE
jgi:hypothetical protein